MMIVYGKVPIESKEAIEKFGVEEFYHVCKYKGILSEKIKLYLEEIDEWAKKNCLESTAKRIAATEKINYDQAVFIVIGYILKALTLEESNQEVILICKKKLFSLS